MALIICKVPIYLSYKFLDCTGKQNLLLTLFSNFFLFRFLPMLCFHFLTSFALCFSFIDNILVNPTPASSFQSIS